MRVVLVGLVAGACLAACGGGGKSGPVTGPVTYYKDVLPLVSAHCGGCHASGGFAPFSLTSYDEARGYAALAAAATQSGEMPPWPPAAGCGDFADARTLSADEIAVFAAWDQAGAPAGDPERGRGGAAAGVDLGPPERHAGSGRLLSAERGDHRRLPLLPRRSRPGVRAGPDRLRRAPGNAGQRAPRAGVRGAAGRGRRGAEQGRGRAGARLDAASPAVDWGPPPMRRRRSAAGFPARARLRSRRGRVSAWTPGRGSSSRCTTTCSPARPSPTARRSTCITPRRRSRSARSSCRSRTPPS